ncbi:MAG: NRDE family protein [Pseudomonadota bacterium]
MCLLIFAHRTSDRLPLVVAANRDEFHARPTAAAQFWPEAPLLLAGKDLQAGGTWMGITRSGRFAAITNFRRSTDPEQAARSRGHLTTDFLLGKDSPEDYMTAIAPYGEDYGGYNLLLGAGAELWYHCNVGRQLPQSLAPGLYGLGNTFLDNAWPKIELGKQRLCDLLASGDMNHAALATVVGNREPANPHQLQEFGLTGPMDAFLSAQFIQGAEYGTRATTSLWLQADGQIHWREQSFQPTGAAKGVSEFQFQLEPSTPVQSTGA